jgi:hypothetical protein
MRSIRQLVFAAGLLAVFAVPASAIPLLQLDIAGGVYDPVTQTVVATSDPFVVSAILTPKTGASAADIAKLLADTYYVSIALSPQVGPTNTNLGSFKVGGTTVSATSGMTYGNPPLETITALLGQDPGDLAPHGMYPTFFYEKGFQFSPTSKTTAYNTADNPSGLTPNAAGTAYYFSFTVDSRLLDPAYVLHFDLYDTSVVTCKNNPNCVKGDIDIDDFAPFSHDAQSGGHIPPPPPQVPEAGSLSMLLMGAGTFVALRSRKR